MSGELFQKDRQDLGLEVRVAGDAMVQVRRHGQDVLPQGNEWQHLVDQVCGGLSRAPRGAAGAEAPVLARKSDQVFLPAPDAPHPEEALRQDAAGARTRVVRPQPTAGPARRQAAAAEECHRHSGAGEEHEAPAGPGGRPRWARIFRAIGPSSTSAMMRRSPPQNRQARTSTAKTLRKSSAQEVPFAGRRGFAAPSLSSFSGVDARPEPRDTDRDVRGAQQEESPHMNVHL